MVANVCSMQKLIWRIRSGVIIISIGLLIVVFLFERIAVFFVTEHLVRHSTQMHNRATSTEHLLQNFTNRLLRENATMTDPMMLEVLRRLIVPPSTPGRQRLSKDTQSTSNNAQYGQSTFVDNLLKGRTNGFFVECGAADGETLSNSIFFELRRNWTGLLMEVNPDSYRQLRLKNRHAYSLRACLSPINSPQIFNLRPYGGLLGGLTGYFEPAHVKTITDLKYVTVTEEHDILSICYPFYSIMLALGRTRIDYFSLDVEGPELQILETIPFDRLIIDVILVEYMVWGSEEATAAKLYKIRRFFRKTKAYKEVGILGKHDIAFRRKF